MGILKPSLIPVMMMVVYAFPPRWIVMIVIMMIIGVATPLPRTESGTKPISGSTSWWWRILAVVGVVRRSVGRRCTRDAWKKMRDGDDEHHPQDPVPPDDEK